MSHRYLKSSLRGVAGSWTTVGKAKEKKTDAISGNIKKEIRSNVSKIKSNVSNKVEGKT